MKVVLATPRITEGGPANLYRALARWLDQRGHTVLAAYDASLEEHVDLGGNIVCHALRSRRRGMLAGVPAIAMRRLVARERPDIVMASMTMVPTIALAGLFARGSTRCVARPVNPPDEVRRQYGTTLRYWLQSWSLRRADALVAQSDDIARWARENGCTGPVPVIGNPVTMAPPDAARPFALCGNPAMVAVGRLTRQKGYDLMLEAYARARVALPQSHLHIMGDGDQKSELVDLIHRFDLDPHVTLHGQVADVRDYLQAADMFVTTSRYEGFANSVVEAQSMGVPVLATDGPGSAARVLATTQGGVLVESGNVEAIADGLRTLATSLGAYDRADIAARTRAAWGVDIVCAAYEDLFLRLARSPGTKPSV